MAAIVIPTNYSWSHLGKDGSRGPSLLEFATAISEDFAAINVRIAANQAALDTLITAYNNHRAAAGVHVDADTENGITAPVATDVTADVLALVNNAAAMYIAHVAQGAAIHPGGADAVNALTATNPATNEAEAATLMTDIKDQYELHRANNGGAYHTNPDAVNTIAEADGTDWDTTVTLANGFKNTTGFNAHVILTAGPVHGATGAVDLITAADAGTQIAALYAELIEMKDDYSIHSVHLGYHSEVGAVEATADATTEATAVALANAFKATLNVHFADAGVHLNADPSVVVAADCTEYEDALPLVLACRTPYTAHLALSAVHAKADAANAGVALGVGGAVTVKTVMGSVAT